LSELSLRAGAADEANPVKLCPTFVGYQPLAGAIGQLIARLATHEAKQEVSTADARKCTQIMTGVNRLSERIISGAIRVVNTRGAGFVEKVYESALAHALRKSG
jgi:hypothetical protein